MSERKHPLDNLTSLELLRTDSGITIGVSKEVMYYEQREIWEMLQEGFTDLNRRSYEAQSMTREEFLADICSPDVLKYTARHKGKTAGYMAVHVGLGHISWTDVTPLVERQNQIDETAVPYYIGTLVVRRNLRGREVASRLLQGAYLHFQQVNAETRQDAVCFFDCSDENYPQIGIFAQKAAQPSRDFAGVDAQINELHTDYWVQDMQNEDKIEKMKTVPSDIGRYKVLDRQHYYAVRIATP